MSGWQISTQDIPRVSDFATAERLWNEAKPWRNEQTSWRQLAERRAKHKRIVQINGGDGYQLVLYSTPMVTYYKDGRVELRTYDSASTQMFAWRVRPEGTQVHSVGSTMYWEFDDPDGARFVREGRGPLCLEPAGINRYRLTTVPAQDYEWGLDRKAAAAVRKKLGHYKRWFEVTERLQGIRPCVSVHRANVRQILDDPENPEAFNLHFGPAQNLYHLAYKIEGARYEVPVPTDRLPRRKR